MPEFIANNIVPILLGSVSVSIGLIGLAFNVGSKLGETKSPGADKIRDAHEQAERQKREAERQTKIAEEANARAAKQANDIRRYRSLKEALLGGDKSLWNSHPTVPIDGYDTLINSSEINVVAVMNLKGGVGKTTITSNLAAHFSQSMNKRVLIVDLDYQGSATAALLRMMRYEDVPYQHAKRMFSSANKMPTLPEFTMPIGDRLPRVDLVPCSYEFAALENRNMVSWLFQETDHDPRYRLPALLYSEEFRERYDVVIIDAPPRLSLGAINALTACRTLLVPTIPDLMSTEAVGNFMSQLNALAEILNPALQRVLLGVNRSASTNMSSEEQRLIKRAEEYMSSWRGVVRTIPQNIPNRVVFGKALSEQTIAYLMDDKVTSQTITSILSEFGDFVAYEMGLRADENVR
ncbi:MAG: ParA family protein [Pseudomonadota bacterium]